MTKILKVTEDAILAIMEEELKRNPKITKEELAKRIGCSTRTVFRYRKYLGYESKSNINYRSIILSCIKEHPSYTVKDVEAATGFSRKTVEKYLPTGYLPKNNDSLLKEQKMIKSLELLGYTITKN